MLEAAARLVHQRGYRGVSLNDILTESDAPRGSLYHHFPEGKDQLVQEAMLREVERIDRFLLEAFHEAADPVEGVRAYVGAAAEELQSSGFVLGCPVAPVILDSPEASSNLARACRESIERWHRILRNRFLDAGLPSPRAESLAVLVVSAVEGALILARGSRDIAPLDRVQEELATVLADALSA
ncbi:MAG: TetR/AcrR family transcriptional regulator [Gemmatimonadales bacterium]|nr:MAG: TetR/AcrR family transcriptional regulator [Gemmatimonadales bacterium]